MWQLREEARLGTQGLKGARERSVIPQKLCEHIVDICEDVVEKEDESGNGEAEK